MVTLETKEPKETTKASPGLRLDLSPLTIAQTSEPKAKELLDSLPTTNWTFMGKVYEHMARPITARATYELAMRFEWEGGIRKGLASDLGLCRHERRTSGIMIPMDKLSKLIYVPEPFPKIEEVITSKRDAAAAGVDKASRGTAGIVLSEHDNNAFMEIDPTTLVPGPNGEKQMPAFLPIPALLRAAIFKTNQGEDGYRMRLELLQSSHAYRQLVMDYARLLIARCRDQNERLLTNPEATRADKTPELIYLNRLTDRLIRLYAEEMDAELPAPTNV